ncbi:MAG TPA: DoxX family protein [Caulobacteraceae bacterium]|jgi:putative oxidoreductase
MNSTALAAFAPRMLSVLRIVTGLLLLQHGTMKMLSFPAGQMAGMGFDPSSLAGWSGIFELVGGVLILLGLFTRPAAFVMAGFMAVAYWTAHAPQGFYPINNQGELAVLYCFVFLYLMCAGAGPWSLDAILRKRV